MYTLLLTQPSVQLLRLTTMAKLMELDAEAMVRKRIEKSENFNMENYGLNVCRFCLHGGTDLIDLFSGNDEQLTAFREKLNISFDEKLPNQICKTCTSQAKRTVNLWTLADKTQDTIKKLFSNVSDTEECVDLCRVCLTDFDLKDEGDEERPICGNCQTEVVESSKFSEKVLETSAVLDQIMCTGIAFE
jgi:hypothetical protein